MKYLAATDFWCLDWIMQNSFKRREFREIRSKFKVEVELSRISTWFNYSNFRDALCKFSKDRRFPKELVSGTGSRSGPGTDLVEVQDHWCFHFTLLLIFNPYRVAASSRANVTNFIFFHHSSEIVFFLRDFLDIFEEGGRWGEGIFCFSSSLETNFFKFYVQVVAVILQQGFYNSQIHI